MSFYGIIVHFASIICQDIVCSAVYFLQESKYKGWKKRNKPAKHMSIWCIGFV